MCQITKPSVQDWIDYEGTNIIGKKVVNHYKTQLNDALIKSCAVGSENDGPMWTAAVVEPVPVWDKSAGPVHRPIG